MNLVNDILERAKYMWGRRNEPEAHHMFAILYWRTLLAVALVALVFVSLYGAWTLRSVTNTLDVAPKKISLPAPPLDRTQLTKTLDMFEKKKSDYIVLTAHGTTVFTDPSR